MGAREEKISSAQITFGSTKRGPKKKSSVVSVNNSGSPGNTHPTLYILEGIDSVGVLRESCGDKDLGTTPG